MIEHSDTGKHSLTVPLLFLFIGSGVAALIYEVVWFHLLRFTVGSSAVSLGILLASFMGGLCLGSFLFHRYVSLKHHPLEVYAFLELGIGLFGILVPLILPAITGVYVSLAGYGFFNILVRGLVCALILLPPTMLMGATLPAISRWVEMSRDGISRIGIFYGANIIGAVFGTLLAGFYLLRVYDIYIATSAAVFLNLLIGLAGLFLAKRTRYDIDLHSAPKTVDRSHMSSIIYFVIALSGVTALGAQVIWTRLLSLLFGVTVYTFSIILAVFLVGLGIGSAVGVINARNSTNPKLLLGFYQFFLVLCIAYAAYAITTVIPDLYFFTPYESWLTDCINDILRCAVAILPATVFWGASFPVALASIGAIGHDPGKWVGRIYAANTIGAIAGATLFSILLIPLLGTKISQQLLVITAAIAAMSMFVIVINYQSINRRANSLPGSNRTFISLSVCIAVLTTGVLISQSIPDVHNGMIAYGREVYRWNEPEKYLHTSEGINASVAVSVEKKGRYRNFHIGGKIVASTWPQDMLLQRMLGHMPALLHPDPKSVLVIGFGAGVTAGTFTLYPGIERIVIVEIEPEVTAASRVYFKNENYNILDDPRTEIIYDDARHFITTTNEKFDIITADPIHPWVKGAAALYTAEFFRLCKQRLNPNGFITQWVPMYETNIEAVKSEIGTFLEVFPFGSIWSSDPSGKGYDLTLLGQVEDIRINVDLLNKNLAGNRKVNKSLSEVNIKSVSDILNSFSGRRVDVAEWLQGYQPNLDRNLKLEYLAGRALDIQMEKDIYSSMIQNLTSQKEFFRFN
jgi:spermidine synthase